MARLFYSERSAGARPQTYAITPADGGETRRAERRSTCRPADIGRQKPTMAQDGAELTFDPFPSGMSLEHVPDSTSLRVSCDVTHESGIPPARYELGALFASEERVELALAGVTRTEANLGQLLRGLKHLAAGASAAREANLELVHELDELRSHLAQVNEEEAALRYRTAQLEQLVELVRGETAREREFLIEQQDLFLVEIMNDHERQIADLRRSLLEAANRRADARELAELTAQRDQAREYALRCERERDLAWQELALGHATTLPPSVPEGAYPTAHKSGATAIGSIALKAVKASSTPDAEREPTGYSLSGDDLK